MWDSFLVNLNEIAVPFLEKPSADPTPEMTSQGYDAKKMFEIGNEFYTSMGLKPVPDTFASLRLCPEILAGLYILCISMNNLRLVDKCTVYSIPCDELNFNLFGSFSSLGKQPKFYK